MPPHLTRNASLPPERKRKQGRLGVHDLRPSSCCPEFGRLAYRRQVLDRQVLLKFTSIWGIGPELGLQSDRNHPQARGSGTPIKIPDAVVLTSSLHLSRGLQHLSARGDSGGDGLAWYLDRDHPTLVMDTIGALLGRLQKDPHFPPVA
jgi:hypothetical protein